MEKIIKHRGQLLNYFFNQSKEYSKVEILNKALNGEVTPNIPVSILKKHNNLIIIKIRV